MGTSWRPAEQERRLRSGQTHAGRSSSTGHLIKQGGQYQSSAIKAEHDSAKEELPGFLRLSQVGNFLVHNPSDGSIRAGSQGRSIAPTSPLRPLEIYTFRCATYREHWKRLRRSETISASALDIRAETRRLLFTLKSLSLPFWSSCR